MSIKSTTFGGVQLSGDEADTFRRQVSFGRPKQAAKESVERGKKMLNEFNSNGLVRIKLKNK